jgi:uncharacterized membrane protein
MVVLDRLDQLGTPGARYFYPTFVSSDGKTVVGAFNVASDSGPIFGGYFRWTKDGGATTLGEPAGTVSGGPEFMSKDGSVVAGMAKISKPADIDHGQFLWTVASGFRRLDATTTWPTTAEIRGLSADGSTVIGETVGVIPKLVFRWTDASGVEPIGSLPGRSSCNVDRSSQDLDALFGGCQNYPDPGAGYRWTDAAGMVPLVEHGTSDACELYAAALSEDGSIAFGNAHCGADPTWTLARWAADTDVELLPQPADTRSELTRDGTSRDGSVAFGVLLPSSAGLQQEGSDGADAFRWSAADGLVPLGHLPGHKLSSPYAADAHGDVLVGRSGISNGESTAVLWDSVGLVSIAAYLESLDVDLHGVHLQSAERVAARGETTVVQGLTNLQDRSGAWFAWLPRR